MDDKEHKLGFHFDKTISVTHIITTAMLCVSGVWWGASVETRLLVDSTKIETVKHDVARVQSEARDNRGEVREQLRSINDKLDRLVERGVNASAISQKPSPY